MSLFKHLLSLDTLDKRLTTPSKALVVSKREIDPAKPVTRSTLPEGASPSLWNTTEFYFYYLTFIICVPLMFKAVLDVSSCMYTLLAPMQVLTVIASHPNYKDFEGLLSQGWIPGRKIDNSDGQYSGFRENIPYLFILLIAHPLLRKVWNTAFPVSTEKKTGRQETGNHGLVYSPEANARLDQRVGYDFAFAIVFLCALHGFSMLKVLIIVTANYLIAKRAPRESVVPLTWLFNILTLFANELCKGYPYSRIALNTLPWTVSDPNSNWGTYLDSHGGLMPRWEILFNITVLRLISFNMDYYWSRDQKSQTQYLEVCGGQLRVTPKANSYRRDRLILLIYLIEMWSVYPHDQRTMAFEITWHISSMHHFT